VAWRATGRRAQARGKIARGTVATRPDPIQFECSIFLSRGLFVN
jgi:hypothetical protein